MTKTPIPNLRKINEIPPIDTNPKAANLFILDCLIILKEKATIELALYIAKTSSKATHRVCGTELDFTISERP